MVDGGVGTCNLDCEQIKSWRSRLLGFPSYPHPPSGPYFLNYPDDFIVIFDYKNILENKTFIKELGESQQMCFNLLMIFIINIFFIVRVFLFFWSVQIAVSVLQFPCYASILYANLLIWVWPKLLMNTFLDNFETPAKKRMKHYSCFFLGSCSQ